MRPTLAVAGATAAGAAIAWVFIRHGGAGWWLVLPVLASAAIAEAVVRLSRSGLTLATACARIDRVGRAAAVSVFALGVLGAAAATYLAADVIGFDTSEAAPQDKKDRIASENKAVAAGLGALAAALTSLLVESLKAGPVGSRVRREYGKKFPDHDALRENLKHHWATATSRREICKRLQQSRL